MHGHRRDRRADPGRGGQLRRHRDRGVERRLQAGDGHVHRHGAGHLGADGRRDCHGRHGEHRGEGGGIRDRGRDRLGGRRECRGEGGRGGADGDVRRGGSGDLVGERAGERGLHYRDERGGVGDGVEDGIRVAERADGHARGGPGGALGELRGAGVAAGGGGARGRDAEHQRHRHCVVRRERSAVGPGHRRDDGGDQRHAGHGRREHRERHGDGEGYGRQPGDGVDRLPDGGQGGPGPDGVRLQL